MNNILALDLGTKMGWALLSDELITSGTENFKPSRFEGGGMCYVKFHKFLTEIKSNAGEITSVYFEEVRRHLGVDAAHKYGGFMSHLQSWCERYDIPYAGVPVGTIKKHLTGKGNANKDMMVAAIKELGFNPIDDNEADALALLKLVREKY